MASIYPYKNYIEIPVSTFGSWHFIDVSQYLENSTARGVIVEIHNTDASNEREGDCYGFNQHNDGWINDIYRNGYVSMVARFKGEDKILRVRLENADVKLYLTGELQAGCVFNQASQSIGVSPTEVGDLVTWLDRTVTLVGDDSYADVEAVILSVRSINVDAQWGARCKGSSWNDTFASDLISGRCWQPTGVDANGQYQVWVMGKVEPPEIWTDIREIGYIKKGTYTSVLNPAAETLAQAAYVWETLDLSGTVPVGGRVAIVKWGWLSGVVGNPMAYVRELGSTNGPGLIQIENQVTSPIVKLNEDRECQYTLLNTNQKLFVLGYEDYSPIAENSTLIIDGDDEDGNGALTMDGGTLIIDRG